MLNTRRTRTLQYKETDLYYQSKLEKLFLDLAENNDLIKEIRNGISFRYKFDSDDKIYVSDFYMPKKNLIIEIKSKWTYNNHGMNKKLEEKNHMKWKSVTDSGYEMIVLIDKEDVNEFFQSKSYDSYRH